MGKLESPLTPAARAVGDTREGVFVSIDLVRFTGDVLSAALLGQLLYWFGTGKDGFCRAQVKVKLTEDDIEKRGIDPALADVPWLAKGDEAWFDETGLTAAQARRVREMFKRDGWIATVTKRFAGNPTTHITLLPKLLTDLETWYGMPAAERVKRDRITLARRVRSDNDADGLANDAERVRLANDASLSANNADGFRQPRGSITDDLQPTSQTTSPPGGADVASDAPPLAAEEPPSDRENGAFQVIARGFGYEPVGLPDPIRDKIRSALRATKAAGLTGDPDRLAGLVWLFRARGGRDPGKFGNAVAVLALDEEVALLPHRPAAATVLDEALGHLTDLAGRPKGVTRPEAEYGIAAALAAGYSRGAIKTAMLTAASWGKGTLLHEIGSLRSTRGARGVSTIVPDDLAQLTDHQLVEHLKAGAELERVCREITERLQNPTDQAETIGRYRTLLAGADGWPRGTSGPVNEARFRITGWIRTQTQAGAQPALPRGA